MNKLLEDCNGNKSSKRLLGATLLCTGILFSILLFAFSLFKSAADASTAMSVINVLLLSGGGLLGIGVFEKVIKK
jgi:hypothetical protein